ncbi:MAG TPA: nuclease-related domain-containing protein [Clostridiales bacterium]|nr:nuclease-related domain-containing protein [Clostridiales bacterium]
MEYIFLIPPVLIIVLVIVIILIFKVPGGKAEKYKNSDYAQMSGNNYRDSKRDLGVRGEYLTFLELEKLPGNKLLLANLYIPKKSHGFTEIDFVVLAETGIYVIESKNLSGTITGAEGEKFWSQVLTQKTQHSLYNPIWQNRGHMTALKNLLGFKSYSPFVSYIVFSDQSDIENVEIVSSNTYLVYRSSLFLHMRDQMSFRRKIFSQRDINSMYKVLSRYANPDERTKAAHLASVKANSQNDDYYLN